MCAAAALPCLLAQFESGTVLGTIHDATGAAVTTAQVTPENVKTGVALETLTDANGNYEFVNQRLGSYRVKITHPGFQTAETEPFDVAVNARERVELTLQVGQATESVTVTGAAELLETDSSSRGQVINPREIVELPLNGRAYADLTLLAPGRGQVATRKRQRCRPRAPLVSGALTGPLRFSEPGAVARPGILNVPKEGPERHQHFDVTLSHRSVLPSLARRIQAASGLACAGRAIPPRTGVIRLGEKYTTGMR